MRVYLQRAGYSLQQDGNLTRPDDAKRKEYFGAVIKEWEAFEANKYHDFYPNGFDGLFKDVSAGIINSKENLLRLHFTSLLTELRERECGELITVRK